ncbi:MAG: hypothetical protein CVU00_01620 [Bacteroidetes bacterium HGW-Bacteroidetes-17]|jgi:hypothetical protein|nr:MAG: hypothetical protein CVU00_01620 [Bacteroidetes bacterium HGW-Bacteroidetes-17]
MKKFIQLVLFAGLASFIISCGSSVNKKVQSNEEPKTDTIAKEVKTVKSDWKKVYALDEFGDKIESKYTLNVQFMGTMTNSLETGSNITVKMQIKDSIIYTIFYDYSDLEDELPNGKSVNLKVKIENGEVLQVRQYFTNNRMIDKDKVLLKLLLAQEVPLKVIADLSMADSDASTVYKYNISTAGLKDLLK